jgi:hypothetical protein
LRRLVSCSSSLEELLVQRNYVMYKKQQFRQTGVMLQWQQV